MNPEGESEPMDNKIDARGKACPIPVIMAKKEADRGNRDFTMLVDNTTAVENLMRFGKNSGFDTDMVEKGTDQFAVRFIRHEEIQTLIGNEGNNQTAHSRKADIPRDQGKTWAVFIGREGIGNGDLELGESLMKMFFYTLTQGEETPDFVLFMNDGVKVPVANEQAVEHLQELQDRETRILVCGTCLKYYKLEDSLKVGTVSNMYDIAEAMQAVDKVITL